MYEGTETSKNYNLPQILQNQDQIKVLGLAFLIIGGAFFATAAGMGIWWYNGEQAKSWPTTEGTILTNDIISTSGGYQNRILFRYTVAGQDYTSDRIYNADVTVTYGNSDHVTDIANQFPVGNTADVYYNPENPELCALIPGANLVATILFIVFGSLGGLFFLIGFVLYNRFRNPKPGREPPSNPVWV